MIEIGEDGEDLGKIKNSIFPNLKPAWILSFLVFGEDGEDVLEKSQVILKTFIIYFYKTVSIWKKMVLSSPSSPPDFVQ